MARNPSPDAEVDRLLALAARPNLGGGERDRLARAFAQFSDWEALVPRAEAHGLAPLLRAHLRASGVAPPAGVASQLLGLAALHRRRAADQEAALGGVLAALAEVDVSPLLLKGAVLARLIYPEPALRPMADLDLLVAPNDLDRAWRALLRLGFSESPPPPSRTAEKHRAATRESGGVMVSVELHFELLAPEGGRTDPRAAWSSLVASAITLDVAGHSARTLGPTRFLWNLCRHLRAHADVFTPLRLVWIADVVAFAERFVAEIDWPNLRERDPEVIRTLSLLDAVVPLAPAVRAATGLELAGTQSGREWADFTGWPRHSLAELRAVGLNAERIARATLWPSAWWLRLHHGLAATDPIVSHRLFHHPREILGWSIACLRERALAPAISRRQIAAAQESARATPS